MTDIAFGFGIGREEVLRERRLILLDLVDLLLHLSLKSLRLLLGFQPLIFDTPLSVLLLELRSLSLTV